MFRRKESLHKKVLERKLCLARETPEAIFDLSDCHLLQLPQGIYSLCKVFRKESLNLQKNKLTSLFGGGCLKDIENLTILDISENCFIHLPDNIFYLRNLQELYVQFNRLKQLPNSLGELINLRILDVSNNELKTLPESICKLSSLRQLQIANNIKLKKLPKNIHQLRNLVLLDLDYEEFLYPPVDIVKGGISTIMKYVTDDNNNGYNNPVDENVEVRNAIEQHDTLELNKQQEFLEIERNNQILQKQELELLLTKEKYKQKLLISVVQQQDELDRKLSKIQTRKEHDQFNLIEKLKQTENNADVTIKKLLALNKRPSLQLLERERVEEQKLLAAVNKYQETFNKSAILNAMQEILSQEAEKFKKCDQMKIETSKSILEQEFKIGLKFSSILKDYTIQKNDLVETLQNDNDLQKVAVMTLLERGDARSWALLQQVRMVEAQLLTLTNMEIQSRMLKTNKQFNDLSQQRVGLSALLMDLMDKQKVRREHLLDTLRSIEKQNKGDGDFWLQQYQKLLEKSPESLSYLQKNLDPKLVEVFLENGLLQFLPFLAHLSEKKFSTSNIVEADLIETGIAHSEDRRQILDVLSIYARLYSTSYLYSPSAPVVEINEPSAPPLENITFNSSECAVCLDFESRIIFVPCGHLCCCLNCSQLLMDCPLCRVKIEKKILI